MYLTYSKYNYNHIVFIINKNIFNHNYPFDNNSN